MYYASTADVFVHFVGAMACHDGLDKEVHFCVRSVPHGFLHPLQNVSSAELAAKEREQAVLEASSHAMGFHITNSNRDVIIQYKEYDSRNPQLDQEQNLDDHASYKRDEETMNELLDDELAKASTSPYEENAL